MCLTTNPKEVSTMKKRILYIAIITAMICTSMLTGCNNEDVVKETIPSETSSSVATTVTTSTQAEEATTEPTTVAETTAETKATTEPQTTVPKQEEPKEETEKTSTNKPSSNNSSGNTTTTQKPAQNTNNNTNNSNQSNKKPNNNTTQTITDDTKLTHKQFSTSANMQRVVTSLNSYYANKGMILNTGLTIDNSGWMFAYQGELNTSAVRSYNEQYNRIVTGLDEQIDAFLEMSEATYSDLTFNCYAQMQSNGEYHIYFCHE